MRHSSSTPFHLIVGSYLKKLASPYKKEKGKKKHKKTHYLKKKHKKISFVKFSICDEISKIKINCILENQDF